MPGVPGVAGRLAVAAAFGTASSLAGVAMIGLAGYLVCRAAEQPPVLALTTVAVGVRATALVRPLARYGERMWSHDVALRCLGRVRVAVYRRLVPLVPVDGPVRRASERTREPGLDGDLLARIVADVDATQDVLLRTSLPAVVAGCAGTVVVAAVWAVPGAGAVCVVLGLGLVVGAVLPGVVAAAVAARAVRRQAGLRGRLTADLVDFVEMADELWLAGADSAALADLAATDRDLASISRRDAWAAGAADAVDLLVTGCTALATFVLATAAAARGDLGPLLVAPLTLVGVAAFEIVRPLSVAARTLPAQLASCRRVLDLVRTRGSPDDPAAAPHGQAPHGQAPHGQAPHVRPAHWQLSHRQPPHTHGPSELGPAGIGPAGIGQSELPVLGLAVRLDGVSVRRGPARRLAVRDAHLRCSPGERVLLTGPSGSGKTTLAYLLVGFLDRAGGEASVDGNDLRAWPGDRLRTRVLLSEQEPHVFDTTVRENVALARPAATDAEIGEALRRARLADFVASLPAGLDTAVGERGRYLSAGQRQRLALARAFLLDPAVLVLDEPTAHLDSPTATALVDDLWREASHRTVVLTTHADPGRFAGCRRHHLHD